MWCDLMDLLYCCRLCVYDNVCCWCGELIIIMQTCISYFSPIWTMVIGQFPVISWLIASKCMQNVCMYVYFEAVNQVWGAKNRFETNLVERLHKLLLSPLDTHDYTCSYPDNIMYTLPNGHVCICTCNYWSYMYVNGGTCAINLTRFDCQYNY